jgi:hypothetical protein
VSRLADRGVGQELTREISALLSEYESRAYWGGILRDGEAITRRVEMTIHTLREVL